MKIKTIKGKSYIELVELLELIQFIKGKFPPDAHLEALTVEVVNYDGEIKEEKEKMNKITMEMFVEWLDKNVDYTICKDCKREFDEDSVECAFCDSKNVVHRITIIKEDLLKIIRKLIKSSECNVK